MSRKKIFFLRIFLPIRNPITCQKETHFIKKDSVQGKFFLAKKFDFTEIRSTLPKCLFILKNI